MLQTFSPKDLMSQDLIFWWLTLECSIYSCISSGEASQKVILLLRATYGAELVSAANLVNTAMPTLSTARLSLCCSKANLVLSGKFDAARQIWCCQANLALPDKFVWNTASSQTVNDVKQIDANVDSKAVVVTKASIRSYIPFNDADGDQPPKTSSSHATTQDSKDSLKETNRNEGDQVQTPHDSPLSGGHTSDRAEGSLNLQELSILCINLSNRVLALESIKDAQAAEISALKSRIKKLEKKCKPSISHHRAWLKSVKRLSMKKRFGKKESVSKQRRINFG
ncbi:hypothetical protein Tco_1027366 [Tanacetum coccineum]